MKRRMNRRLLVVAGMIATLAAPARSGAAPAVALPLASVWSFHVRSQSLLADLAYALDYTFEFEDEEELIVTGIGRSEIAEGRIRTILDGDPVEAIVRMDGESQMLEIHQNSDVFVAGWRLQDRTVAADLPMPELERRWTLMLDLLSETRRRLGLEHFRPSRDPVARVFVKQLDLLEVVPAEDNPLRYAIRKPGTAGASEILVTMSGSRRWEIAWGDGQLDVVIRSERQSPTHVAYRRGQVSGSLAGRTLTRTESLGIVQRAFALLRATRMQFGTGGATTPLPSVVR